MSARDIRQEVVMLADEVEMYLQVEYIDGNAIEADITIDGAFCISGERRAEFGEKMQALVDEYRI